MPVNVELVCVGRLKDRFFEDASKEYLKRLSAFCRVSVAEVPAAPLPDDPSPGEIKAALAKEADAIRAKIKRGAVVYPMCVEGRELTSGELAAEMERRTVAGASDFAFVIGGSYGLDEEIKKLGPRLSMSKMTFPHRLARVMLLEQIYRAFTITAGKKYHK